MNQAKTPDEIKGKYNPELNDQIKIWLASYITLLESIIDLILTESPNPKRHFKYLFASMTIYEKVILLYHFEIGEWSKLLNYHKFYKELFEQLRMNKNSVITHHQGYFEGLKG